MQISYKQTDPSGNTKIIFSTLVMYVILGILLVNGLQNEVDGEKMKTQQKRDKKKKKQFLD